MDLDLALPFLSTIIVFTFAAVVLQRFLRRRHQHNFFWGVGLLMFGLGTFAEAYLAKGWSEPLFRSWYVFGAMLNAAWLGHGTLTLLARRSWVRVMTILLVGLSLLGIIVTFSIPINSAAFTAGRAISEQYKAILPASGVRLLTPFFNVYGTVFLVGGAVYSSYLFWRKQAAPNRMIGNILIAAGALAIASASTLTRLFFGGFLYVGEFIAVVLMFSGFLLATSPAALRATAGEQATPAR